MSVADGFGHVIARAVVEWYLNQMHERSQCPPRRVGDVLEMRYPRFGVRFAGVQAAIFAAGLVALVVSALIAGWQRGHFFAGSVLLAFTALSVWLIAHMRRT